MPNDCISYQNSGYFSPLMNDYLNRKTELQALYHRFPTLENFGEQIKEKQASFTAQQRKMLVSALKAQYSGVYISELTQQNINLLSQENTFTITTGHQLNLFTGPLYFLYKIVSAINLAKELTAQYHEINFVPLYWMATEDHDFEEINYFTFKGKKFRWNRESAGAVGRLSTEELNDVLEVFAREAGHGKNALWLTEFFENAYLKHDNLADATRYLVNELFGSHGLVIIDGDHRELKSEFVPFVENELLHQTSFEKVSQTIRNFGDYNVQVNPREINLFYLDENLRERILFEDGKYLVNNTKIAFTENEILLELKKNPQKFSPNVIMRPLYQEVILPNLCYIGGGGEIAYWLELKSFFETVEIPFPILLLRNSVLLATEKQAKKADKLDLTWADLFLKQQALSNKKIKELSEFPIDLKTQRQTLEKQFADLFEIANKTDKSFSGAVIAQEAKQMKGLENLEKRLLLAQKRKHADELERITDLQDQLFPFKSLQERQANFSEFYLESGSKLIDTLFEKLKPLSQEFTIIVFKA